MNVPVEHEADDPAIAVDQRTAGVTANDVVVGGQVEARVHVEPRARRHPAVGDTEWILAGGPLVQASQIRERLDLASVLAPAPHRADVEPQRESGIRRLTGAID